MYVFQLFADVLYFGLVYIDIETESGAAVMYINYRHVFGVLLRFLLRCNIICKAEIVDDMALYVSSYIDVMYTQFK